MSSPDTVTAPAPADKAPKPASAAAKKAAAKKAAAKPSSSSAGKRRPGRPSNADFRKVVDELVDKFVGALVLAGLGSPRLAYDGMVLANNSDTIKEELYERGLKYPQLRKLIEGGAVAGDWMRLLTIITAVGIPIAANHGLLPLELAGLVTAELPPPREPKPKRERKSPRSSSSADQLPGQMDLDGLTLEDDGAVSANGFRLGFPDPPVSEQ